MQLPPIFRVHQTFDTARVADPAEEVRRQLASLDLSSRLRPGQSVAITAGSRGIADIVEILRAIADFLRGHGTEPFLFPAMGSHGGGTADGQRAVLERLGITEEAVGCPIRGDTETDVVCRTAEGVPVHFLHAGLAADHVLVCNRIKPHTMFGGDIQSGLMKMLLIGAGGPAGAQVYHRACRDIPFGQIVRSVADEVLARCGVLAGVAIVENALDQTARIEAVAPADFASREPELLRLAQRLMPRLPFSPVDILLIDRIGKDISGVGLDVNVVGRKYNGKASTEQDLAEVLRIAVRGLSVATAGNATGMGIADFCLTSMLEDVDPKSTRLNALTSGRTLAAQPPIDFPTDLAMLEAALGTIGLREPADARMLWIPDTLHLSEVECSSAYFEQAKARADLQIIHPPRQWPIRENGMLGW